MKGRSLNNMVEYDYSPRRISNLEFQSYDACMMCKRFTRSHTTLYSVIFLSLYHYSEMSAVLNLLISYNPGRIWNTVGNLAQRREILWFAILRQIICFSGLGIHFLPLLFQIFASLLRRVRILIKNKVVLYDQSHETFAVFSTYKAAFLKNRMW